MVKSKDSIEHLPKPSNVYDLPKRPEFEIEHFLLVHRTTPHSLTGIPLANMFLDHCVNNVLPTISLLKYKNVEIDIIDAYRKSFNKMYIVKNHSANTIN